MKHFNHSAGSCAWVSTAALECWTYIASVDDFALCDPAQYIRIFPRLLPRAGAVPVALRAHITRALAVLAWRAVANGDDAPMEALCAATGVPATDMVTLGAREHGLWFAPADLVPPPGPAGDAPLSRGAVDDAEAFALVAALRREIDAGALRPFALDDAALFAFATGIHPAYVWPEALLSHEFYSAAGWLGHLWRRRRADMPGDLADYFDDVIHLAADGSPWVRDRHLARFLPDEDVVAEVRRAARARRGGPSAVAVWPGPAAWAAAAPERSRAPMRHGGGPS